MKHVYFEISGSALPIEMPPHEPIFYLGPAALDFEQFSFKPGATDEVSRMMRNMIKEGDIGQLGPNLFIKLMREDLKLGEPLIKPF